MVKSTFSYYLPESSNIELARQTGLLGFSGVCGDGANIGEGSPALGFPPSLPLPSLYNEAGLKGRLLCPLLDPGVVSPSLVIIRCIPELPNVLSPSIS